MAQTARMAIPAGWPRRAATGVRRPLLPQAARSPPNNATAIGGSGGNGGEYPRCRGQRHRDCRCGGGRRRKATAAGGGQATATAVATAGERLPVSPTTPPPKRTSNAETANGAMAQALSTVVQCVSVFATRAGHLHREDEFCGRERSVEGGYGNLFDPADFGTDDRSDRAGRLRSDLRRPAATSPPSRRPFPTRLTLRR